MITVNRTADWNDVYKLADVNIDEVHGTAPWWRPDGKLDPAPPYEPGYCHECGAPIDEDGNYTGGDGT